MAVRKGAWRLTQITVVTLPFTAGVGYARSGIEGILAALLAAGVCAGGAIASLLAIGPVWRLPQSVHRVLLGMLIRMGVPLVACIGIVASSQTLVKAGAPVMILGYYLLMLIAETWLVLKLMSTVKTNETPRE